MEIKEIEIFTFYYKPAYFVPGLKEYTPIWAGKNKKPVHQGFTGDDTGDNISNKNNYYSELTGLYWVWKNTNSKIVGSCHYRRYFTFGNEPFLYQAKRLLYYLVGLHQKRHGLIYTSNVEFWKNRIIKSDEINSLLNTYDAIFPERRILNYSIANHYKRYHNETDLIVLKKIVTELYPDYTEAFNFSMAGNRLFANNMFIMPRDRFEKLMEWLFPILFRFEKTSEMQNFKGYQERIFGFLSERLITVWVEHNKLNYKELPLIYFKKFKTLKS